ncbi:MAG: hypothetical protein AB7N76_25250 [Planctomycetota bacterium]
MSSRGRQRLASLGLLLALLPQLVLAALARGLVVCVERDGCASVELSLSGCCAASEAETAADGAPALDTPEEDCGDCSDSPLALAADRERVDAPTVAAPLVAMLPPWEQLSSLDGGRARAPRPPLRAPPAPQLLQLRTVSLRC